MFRLVRITESDNEFRDQLVKDIVDTYNGQLDEDDAERLVASLYRQANDIIARKKRVNDIVSANRIGDVMQDWEDAITSERPPTEDDAGFRSPDKVSRPHYPESDYGSPDVVDNEVALGIEADLLRSDAGIDPTEDIVRRSDDLRQQEDEYPESSSEDDVEVDLEIETDVDDDVSEESDEGSSDEDEPSEEDGTDGSSESEDEDSEEVELEIETEPESGDGERPDGKAASPRRGR